MRVLPHHRRHARLGQVAPDLTHVASRRTIAAGTLPMNRGQLAAWIADPQALKPGNNMPKVSFERRGASRRDRLSGDAQMSAKMSPSDHLRDGPDSPASRCTQALCKTWADEPGLWGWLSTVDHKDVGRRYIVTAFVFLILGGMLALADAAAARHARRAG